MKLKVRKLNLHERHACSINAVKNIFSNENVYVSFGFLSKDFKFDYSDQKRPKIEGIIVASASINKRDNVILDGLLFENNYYISFYAIKDPGYGQKDERRFIELYLPLLYEWYQEMLVSPETSPSGVENILIEWFHGDFQTHAYRYH